MFAHVHEDQTGCCMPWLAITEGLHFVCLVTFAPFALYASNIAGFAFGLRQSRFQPSEPGLEVASSCAITRRQMLGVC